MFYLGSGGVMSHMCEVGMERGWDLHVMGMYGRHSRETFAL